MTTDNTSLQEIWACGLFCACYNTLEVGVEFFLQCSEDGSMMEGTLDECMVHTLTYNVYAFNTTEYTVLSPSLYFTTFFTLLPFSCISLHLLSLTLTQPAPIYLVMSTHLVWLCGICSHENSHLKGRRCQSLKLIQSLGGIRCV